MNTFLGNRARSPFALSNAVANVVRKARQMEYWFGGESSNSYTHNCLLQWVISTVTAMCTLHQQTALGFRLAHLYMDVSRPLSLGRATR